MCHRCRLFKVSLRRKELLKKEGCVQLIKSTCVRHKSTLNCLKIEKKGSDKVKKFRLLIYGANGYTGTLIVERAIALELEPVVAGRDQSKVDYVASKYSLPKLCFSLKNAVKYLELFDLVIHCAGPFSKTYRPMIEACIATKTHYVDITGEVDVFEALYELNDEITQAGITAIPGAGFDVVPTDCLASKLKRLMPDASSLRLAFDSSGGVSPGTAKTMLEKLGEGSVIRDHGRLKKIPSGSLLRKIDFNGQLKNCVAIPWGDVSTAYRSTGIPRIEVYIPIRKSELTVLRGFNSIAKVLRLSPVQTVIKSAIDKVVEGPSKKVRDSSSVILWGEVENNNGKVITESIVVSEGYKFTAYAALEVSLRILKGELPSGNLTPSQAFGEGFLGEILEVIDSLD